MLEQNGQNKSGHHVRFNHRWDITPKEAVALQRELAPRVSHTPIAREIRTIGGIDVSIRGKVNAASAVVVMSYPECELIEYHRLEMPVPFPYVPGLLSFREIPVLLPVLDLLSELPDVLMVDGQGVAHPRRFGLAAHLGLVLEHPCIGVAKTRLVGTHGDPPNRRGAQVPLMHHEEEIGRVLRTRVGVKPVFVSAGHRVQLSEAVEIALQTAHRFKLPEPARMAHRLSKFGTIGRS